MQFGITGLRLLGAMVMVASGISRFRHHAKRIKLE
jgi:hypothetical protein